MITNIIDIDSEAEDDKDFFWFNNKLLGDPRRGSVGDFRKLTFLAWALPTKVSEVQKLVLMIKFFLVQRRKVGMHVCIRGVPGPEK